VAKSTKQVMVVKAGRPTDMWALVIQHIGRKQWWRWVKTVWLCNGETQALWR